VELFAIPAGVETGYRDGRSAHSRQKKKKVWAFGEQHINFYRRVSKKPLK
jgi:hypothetical protein